MLLFSSLCGFLLLCGFPSLGIFPCLPLWAFFATVSSFGFHLLLSLTASSVPLLLLCSTLLFWVVLRSLGLLCSCGLASFSFLARKFLSPVSGFQLLVFRVFCWSSTGFFFRAPLLSFLPLGCSCLVGVLCVPCSSLLYILLVTVFSVFNCSFFILYRFPVLFLGLPLSLWFRSCSSPASSSSSVP